MRFYLHGRSKPERSPCRSSLPAVGICVGPEETGSGIRSLALFRHSSRRCGGGRGPVNLFFCPPLVVFPPPPPCLGVFFFPFLPAPPCNEMKVKKQVKN